MNELSRNQILWTGLGSVFFLIFVWNVEKQEKQLVEACSSHQNVLAEM